ncbi:MAG: WD40 repeat domain-containing protein [Bacteroidia bacterium]|nr:WD40 repeat domain-containing protein [Bacteroidia bacterium]MCF8445497.1 WD40 repeat domain-containing protein [Bacteroidia bacterium]
MHKQLLTILFIAFAFLVSAQNEPKTTVIRLQGSSNDLNAVAVSPIKYKRMATAGWDNTILIYSTDTPYKLVQKLSGHTAKINKLTYNLSGNMMASASGDMTVRLWDSMYRYYPLQEDLNKRHLAAVNAVIFDKTGRFLFSGDNDGKIMLWDVNKQIPIKYFLTGNSINDMCLSPNPANVFVAHSDRQIKLISLANGKLMRTLDGHTDVVNALAISPNRKYLLSGSNDKTARIWDIRTMKQLYVLPVDCWKVTAVAISDDSKYCATGGNDGSIKVWDLESGKLISSTLLENIYVKDLAFSKDYLNLIVATKLKDGNDYGGRIVPTLIPELIKAQNIEIEKSQEQMELDSILSERTLTKEDSIQYQNLLMPKSDPKTGQKRTGQKPKSAPQGKNQQPVIYKTPIKGQ